MRKSIVARALRVNLGEVFVFSILVPYHTVLKGLLEVSIITAFGIVGALSRELIKYARRLSLINALKWVLVYDIVYMVSNIIGYCCLDSRDYILLMMSMVIPYYTLVTNFNIKYDAWISKIYKRYILEMLNSKEAILSSRVSLLSLAITGLFSLLFDIKYIVIVFVILQAILITYTIRLYRDMLAYL